VDVTSDPPAQDDVLAWDDTENKWTPATLDGGVALSDATPQDLGTAAAGVSDEASRADHVHDMPTAADVGADPAGTAAGLVDDLSGVSNQAQARTNLGLGSAAVADTGTGSSNVILGNDSRLTDARTPTTHAATHADGGSDEISIDASQITTGTVDQARLGTGSAGAGAKFLADDQTYRRAVVGHSQAIVADMYVTGPGRAVASNLFHYLPAVGRQSWHLIWLEAGMYDKIAVITTVAGTSTWRLGLDSATSGLRPDVNVLDAGVVDMSVTPGLLACTVSFTVTVSGWFFARAKCETFTSAPTAYVVDGVSPDTNMFVPGWPTVSTSLPARQLIALTSLVTTPAGPFGPPPALTGNGSTGIGYNQSGARLYVRKAS